VNVLITHILPRVPDVSFVYSGMQAGVQEAEVRNKKGVVWTACKIFKWGYIFYTSSEVRQNIQCMYVQTQHAYW